MDMHMCVCMYLEWFYVRVCVFVYTIFRNYDSRVHSSRMWYLQALERVLSWKAACYVCILDSWEGSGKWVGVML